MKELKFAIIRANTGIECGKQYIQVSGAEDCKTVGMIECFHPCSSGFLVSNVYLVKKNGDHRLYVAQSVDEALMILGFTKEELIEYQLPYDVYMALVHETTKEENFARQRLGLQTLY